MSEVKLDASGLTTPSIVLGDNVLTSEEDKLIWNGEEFKSSGSGHNVGEQWISMDGTIPFGGLPFLGQNVSRETYSDLFEWVKINNRFKTEEEWQSLYTSNNGNVSFYAYNGQIGKKAHADFSDDYYAHLYEGTYFYSYFIEEEEYIFDKDVTLEGIKEYANHISENSNFDVEIIYLENETYAFKFIAKEVGTQFNDISITHINVAGTILGEGARVEMYTTEGEDEVLSDTFRLPSFKGYLKANETAGEYNKEGLPNITGHMSMGGVGNASWGTGISNANGAIVGGYQTNISSTTTPSNIYANSGFDFNASKSNSIYGNSSHVTPETNTIIVGVYAFNTIINPSNLDVESLRHDISSNIENLKNEYVTNAVLNDYATISSLSNYAKKTDLNSYATTSSLSSYIKTSTLKSYITATWQSGTSWYRKYSDGWIEQGGISAAISGAGQITVSLNTAFKNTNYTITIATDNTDPGADQGNEATAIKSKSTTSFNVYKWNMRKVSWYACGY